MVNKQRLTKDTKVKTQRPRHKGQKAKTQRSKGQDTKAKRSTHKKPTQKKANPQKANTPPGPRTSFVRGTLVNNFMQQPHHADPFLFLLHRPVPQMVFQMIFNLFRRWKRCQTHLQQRVPQPFGPVERERAIEGYQPN